MHGCQSIVAYEQRNPAATQLYKVISENLNSFLAERTEEGRNLPKFIVREFESYLRCGIYAHGFGRVQCGSCQHEKIVPYSCKGRGFCPSCGARRMAEAAIHLVDELLPLVPVRQFVITFPVQLRLWMARSKSLCAKVCEKVCAELTAHLQRAAGIEDGLSGLVVFIQRFGSAANLNIHFHVIALDGVYEKKSTGRLKFYPAQAPSNETIQNLVGSIATKINNLLIRKKYLEKVEDMVLVGNTEDIFNESGQHSHEDVHLPAQAASVTHRIAFGPNTGQPVRRLKSQTSLWPPEQNFKSTSTACVLAGGYSVHAETAIKAHERERLEKLVRYMARPAISDERVIIEGPESIRIKLKSAWTDGTHSLLFTPSEFLERLVALIPAPKFHTTRYYGVLASRSPHRRYLPDKPTPLIDTEHGADGQDSGLPSAGTSDKKQKPRKRKRIPWAQLLKRTFKIDVLKCDKCGGRMKLVDVVFDPPTIATTLRALGLPVRAPPIAPARSRSLLDSSHDWTGVDVDYGWPD